MKYYLFFYVHYSRCNELLKILNNIVIETINILKLRSKLNIGFYHFRKRFVRKIREIPVNTRIFRFVESHNMTYCSIMLQYESFVWNILYYLQWWIVYFGLVQCLFWTEVFIDSDVSVKCMCVCLCVNDTVNSSISANYHFAVVWSTLDVPGSCTRYYM